MHRHTDSDAAVSAVDTSRRRFVQGLALGSAVLATGWAPRLVWADAGLQSTPVLSGREFDLRIGETAVNFTGRSRLAVTVNGSLPAPILRCREGDEITLRVTNTLHEDTSLHWHGILLPSNMDGVPGLSFAGIRPGETFTYRFALKQSGTYWYHSHSHFQEQRGLYGALIIDPVAPEPFAYDREFVLLLSDWSDSSPERIAAILKKDAHYYNTGKRTVADFWREVREQGFWAAWSDSRAWAAMRMEPTDLADVTGYTYTYLMNGHTPSANWTGLFKPGERIRLRLINGSAMSYFDVRIPGLTLTVVAADGQNVQPVTVDELRIAAAETYDLIVEAGHEPAYTIFAQSLDRSGYACGTLAQEAGLRAALPLMDPRPTLSMADMGHGGHADHAVHQGHANLDHPTSEARNALVDMQTGMPEPRLDDPGIGLRALDRNQGRRVLTYADLHSSFPDPDGREPARTLILHLTGHMERYAWSFDGIAYADAEPIRLRYGERLRIVLVNDTMMEHPIHLHGLWSDLEDEQGHFKVRKHTVTVPPGTRRSFRVTADALGRWAFHCHLLYHMHGMFREVRVEA